MKWIIDFLLSSLGRKLIMSMTGLFLCLFLIVHMVGNLQLFLDNDGAAFNMYAYHMTTNPFIKVISYGNYFFILLHAFQGILITMGNRKAKGGTYQGKQTADTTAKMASRNMRNLGLLLFVFLGLHMYQFWAQMHFGGIATATYEGVEVKNLYIIVEAAFAQLWIVLFYLVSLFGLGLHLWHGFWSAFQSMGLSNSKYTPMLRAAALGFAIILPLGFATMPIVFFLKSM